MADSKSTAPTAGSPSAHSYALTRQADVAHPSAKLTETAIGTRGGNKLVRDLLMLALSKLDPLLDVARVVRRVCRTWYHLSHEPRVSRGLHLTSARPNVAIPETQRTLAVGTLVGDRAKWTGITVTASNSWHQKPADQHLPLNVIPAFCALHTQPIGGWNSGGFVPQWIELQLVGPSEPAIRLDSIRLLIDQLPAGRTTHVVEAVLDEPLHPNALPANRNPIVKNASAGAGTGLTVLTVFDQHTDHRHVLRARFGAGNVDHQPRVRALRIRTIVSPSWIAWSQIHVIGSINTHHAGTGTGTAAGTKSATATAAVRVSGMTSTASGSGSGSAASWLLIMTGGGVPVLSLTRGITSTSAGSTDEKGAVIAPVTVNVDPFKFAHQGSLFTLHTTASNAEFTVSHLLSTATEKGSGNGVNDASIGYAAYQNDNLLFVWSNAETDLLTVGSANGAGSKIRARIDRMYDACVSGLGLTALLQSRADNVKKLLKSVIPVLSVYLSPPPALVVSVHTGIPEVVLPSALTCGALWRALHTIRKHPKFVAPTSSANALALAAANINRVALYAGHRLVCATREWSTGIDARDLLSISSLLAVSSAPAAKPTGTTVDVPIYFAHTAIMQQLSAPVQVGDAKQPPAATAAAAPPPVVAAPPPAEVIGRNAFRLVSVPLVTSAASVSPLQLVFVCAAAPLPKDIDTAISESGLRTELNELVVSDLNRRVPASSGIQFDASIRGVLFVINWQRIVFVTAPAAAATAPSDEVERALTFFYHTAAPALHQPTASSTAAAALATSQVTDSIMRTQNGTFVAAVRHRTAAPAPAGDTKSGSAAAAKPNTPASAAPATGAATSASAIFVFFYNTTPYSALMPATSKLHDKFDALIPSSA